MAVSVTTTSPLQLASISPAASSAAVARTTRAGADIDGGGGDEITVTGGSVGGSVLGGVATSGDGITLLGGN